MQCKIILCNVDVKQEKIGRLDTDLAISRIDKEQNPGNKQADNKDTKEYIVLSLYKSIVVRVQTLSVQSDFVVILFFHTYHTLTTSCFEQVVKEIELSTL